MSNFIPQSEIDRFPGYYNTWIHTTSDGDTYPETVDDTSSPSTVYVRKNIKPYEKIDDREIEGKEPSVITGYEFDMMRIPRQDWDAKKEIVTLRAEVDSLTEAINSLATLLAGEEE